MNRAIETLAFFVLVAIVILRPLVAESYDPAGSPMTEALAGVSDPSPLRTLGFDVLILISACGWLLSRAVGAARRYHWTGLELGTVLVALAAVISCAVAGNKRLAINASIDWLCYPILTITLVQLMGTPWHRRLLLAGLLASAGVQATQCIDQYFLGFGDTVTQYQTMKEEFWAKQGIDLDSDHVELFEQRMLAREASGSLPHSNIAGSYLIVCGLAALGVTLVRWKLARDGLERACAFGCTVATAVILGAAILTKSLGALLAGAGGLAAWPVLHSLRARIRSHPRSALAIGWTGALVALSAFVAYGLHHGSLPHMSLSFRWGYWLGSADLIADHAFTGVGRENFGRDYLQYKVIGSPEEVANPHNLFVQAAADWGVVGLVGILTMMIGVSRALNRPALEPLPEVGPSRSSAGPSRRPMRHYSGILWTVALALVVTLGRLPLLGTSDPSFLYYTTVSTGLVWIAAYVFLATRWVDAPEGAVSSTTTIATGIAVGLFTFVLHDMINFAMFVPATATTFFALLGICIAYRAPVEAPTEAPAGIRRWVPFTTMAGLTAAVLVLIVAPVARSQHLVNLARQASRELAPAPITAQLADVYYRKAAAADPLDPHPFVERALWLLTVSEIPGMRDEASQLAAESLDRAAARDPFYVKYQRMKTKLYLAWAEHTKRADKYLAAVEAAERALALYPLDPAGIASLAECQAQAALVTNSDALRGEALANYRRALDLDDARPWWERIRRFRESKRDTIEKEITRLEGSGPQDP